MICDYLGPVIDNMKWNDTNHELVAAQKKNTV